MPNQLGKDRHRAVFICDTPDYHDLEGYADHMGFTVSVLLREAVYRLSKEIRENGKIVLLRQPRDDEGHPTVQSRTKFRKKTYKKPTKENESSAESSAESSTEDKPPTEP
jgi:hypothetical protein